MAVALKWVADSTGRFTERPHYDPLALDEECERIMRKFLAGKHGRARYPVTTDELTVLIEEHAATLDQFADLPDGIEGRTRFHLGARPEVSVSARLQHPQYENRLRTTLTHELGPRDLRACPTCTADRPPDTSRTWRTHGRVSRRRGR